MNIRTFHSGRHIHHDSEYTNSEILSLKWRYLVEAPTDVRIFDDWIDDDEIFLVILCNTKLLLYGCRLRVNFSSTCHGYTDR